ncbi:hypothetical protein HL42_4549 [Trichophyton rubrum]|nr:hypothetical protein HL42_4549 [Trichophyton rubrum]
MCGKHDWVSKKTYDHPQASFLENDKKQKASSLSSYPLPPLYPQPVQKDTCFNCGYIVFIFLQAIARSFAYDADYGEQIPPARFVATWEWYTLYANSSIHIYTPPCHINPLHS